MIKPFIVEFETNILGKESPDHVLFNVKKNAISLAINIFSVYTFDLRGRLITAVQNGRTYRRSLDNRVMSKWTLTDENGRQKQRKWLSDSQRDSLIGSIHKIVQRLRDRIAERAIRAKKPNAKQLDAKRTDILKTVDAILHFDHNNLARDAEDFESIYGQIGILPPDMYMSLALQATEGCSYNQCNYCSFYEGKPYKIKSPERFDVHIERVKAYFGDSITMRKTVFLGEANALDLPLGRLRDIFATLNNHFAFKHLYPNKEKIPGKIPMHGVYGFMTAFHKPKSVDDLIELRERGLKRVYIGMESGSNNLLHFLNKPGDGDRILSLVESIKFSGIDVGIIILLGAGGDIFFEDHIAETVRIIRAMRLKRGDMVYFSPIEVSGDSGHQKAVSGMGGKMLTAYEMHKQKQEILSKLDFQSTPSQPKSTIYNISEFIY